jgi:quinolinate synthase
MITADQLRRFKEEHPGGTVVTYVNSSAAVKAESDVCCTSANAVQVVKRTDTRRVLFTPDRNLGMWVRGQVDKEMVLWDGYCPTHEYLTAADIGAARAAHPGAVLVVHPECTPDVVALADAVRSTSGMIAYVRETTARTVIVATEMGLLHRLAKERPDVALVSPSRKLVCPNMKKIRLADVLASLSEPERFEIRVPEDVRVRARQALERMIAVPRG